MCSAGIPLCLLQWAVDIPCHSFLLKKYNPRASQPNHCALYLLHLLEGFPQSRPLSLNSRYRQIKCQTSQIFADLKLWAALVKSCTFPLQSYFAVSNWQLSPIQVLWIWHRATVRCTKQTHGVSGTWAHNLIFNNRGTKGPVVSPKVTSLWSQAELALDYRKAAASLSIYVIHFYHQYIITM